MSRTLSLVFVASIIALAGCEQRDPYLRTDVWKPTGANAGNIAAMVADPHDLISGRGTTEQNSNESALAVGHVWQDNPKPFTAGPAAASGASGGTGTGGSTGGGGSGGASGSPGS